jgi:ABC-type multidrug transport system permease subunit
MTRRIMAFVLLIYSVPAFLSGLDIYRDKEPDLSAEWTIVVLYYILTIFFLGLSIFKKSQE